MTDLKSAIAVPAAPAVSYRTQRRARRVDAILDATEEQLAERGLEGLTMARVAAAVDLTPGALYRYFAGKEQLVAGLQVRAIDGARHEFERRRARLFAQHDDASPAAALAGVLLATRVHRELVVHSPQRFGLLAISLADPRVFMDDTAAAPVWQAVMRLLTGLSAALDHAAQAGALLAGDASRRSVLLVMASQGVLQLGKMDRRMSGFLDIDGMAGELSTALLSAWGADPDVLAAAATLTATIR